MCVLWPPDLLASFPCEPLPALGSASQAKRLLSLNNQSSVSFTEGLWEIERTEAQSLPSEKSQPRVGGELHTDRRHHEANAM